MVFIGVYRGFIRGFSLFYVVLYGFYRVLGVIGVIRGFRGVY